MLGTWWAMLSDEYGARCCAGSGLRTSSVSAVVLCIFLSGSPRAMALGRAR
jgi:hypothetical protein